MRDSDAFGRRKRYEARCAALKNERSSWEPIWRELADYIQPRRTRFFTSDRNRGEKKTQRIINSTPTFAADTLAAGMMAGITSPARRWARLTTRDPELAEFGAVRSYLHLVEERLFDGFSRSNLYQCLPTVYLDMGVFGTGCMVLEDDAEGIFRGYVLPVGSYCLGQNDRGEIDTLSRELEMTVGQLVQRFGRDACSVSVQQSYDKGQLDGWVKVQHLIHPNEGYKAGAFGQTGMPFSSCWWEVGGGSRDTAFLFEGGYWEFPVVAPRWQVDGEDIYGTGPGEKALGDAKALQLYERQKADIAEKISKPPMQGPTTLQNQRVSLLPGSMNYVDVVAQGNHLRPAIEVNAQAIPAMREAIAEHEDRIRQAFKADIFLMLSASEDPRRTATEILELKEQKLQMLGPVYNRVDKDLLEKVVRRGIASLLRNGDLPPPPEEIGDAQNIEIEYQSTVAAAQRMNDSAQTKDLVSIVGNLGAVYPAVLDNINYDQVVKELANNLGVNPEILRTDEEVSEMRAAAAKAKQEQAAAEQGLAAVQGAKLLSETNTTDQNAFTDLIGQA